MDMGVKLASIKTLPLAICGGMGISRFLVGFSRDFHNLGYELPPMTAPTFMKRPAVSFSQQDCSG